MFQTVSPDFVLPDFVLPDFVLTDFVLTDFLLPAPQKVMQGYLAGSLLLFAQSGPALIPALDQGQFLANCQYLGPVIYRLQGLDLRELILYFVMDQQLRPLPYHSLSYQHLLG